MKWPAAIAACAVVVTAIFYIGKPWTLHQCMVMAAGMPSDYGSSVMYRHCQDTFAVNQKKPWEMNWGRHTPSNEPSGEKQGFIPLDEASADQAPRDLFKEQADRAGKTVEEWLSR